MIGIYKITNTINNKCYIGQSINIEHRWKEHIQESKTLRSQSKFYLALNQYGAEVFKFEILEECSFNQEILDERERYWIEHYDSFKNGYNSTIGGQSESSWIYNPQITQKLWDEGYSVSEIAEIVGCSHYTVNRHLTGHNDYNTYTSLSRGAQHAIAEGTQRGKPPIAVYQYDLNGRYIAEYESIITAAKALGHEGSSSIRAVLNHECQTAYGYQWSKEKVDSMPIIPVPNGKLVRCINTGKIFHSTPEAARWCNLKSSSNIRDCCRGKCKTAGRHPETGERLEWEFAE